MIDREQANKFRQMEKMAPRLREGFSALTHAHQAFQGGLDLRSLSVSDQLDDESIDVTFHGVQIKFKLLLVFGADRLPRGRVVAIHCHSVYGKPQQLPLGAFTFAPDGTTDLDPDEEGNFPRIDADATLIVLRFLEAAITANRLL